MEFVNQIIAFFTPYLGDYARYVPVFIGTVLAIVAFIVRRRSIAKMQANIAKAKSAKQVDSEQITTEQMTQDHVQSSEPEGNKNEAPVAEEIESPQQEVESPQQNEIAPVATSLEAESEVTPQSWTQRIKSGLSRTRHGLGNGLSGVILGSKKLDDDLLEELETQLLIADVGIDATQALMGGLTDKLNRKELKDADTLLQTLKSDMTNILAPSAVELKPETQDGPFVILMVGVNGVGKTTTIGKLAKKYLAEGKSVMLAAGDTFRAAAVEQLQVWGERNNVPVVAQHTGADSASVIYDAIESAKAKGVDVVIADTAGRLQNKSNLMNELSKVVRVMKKVDENAPHEVMLVLDAGTGQNAISQAQLFSEAVGVSGITLTKLDGTAKGGIIFAIAKQFGLPIRYIGVGEQAEDLRPFVAEEFVDALFASDA
ncbi:signal recognition particle-docking protein FtsY [Marinomonas sp.]|nr:signal recognition particle-docking protein FtsY [Marinomonas sp.]MDB4837136.1 signal recognition particle-docking protein FtsY [Marinomonas sp.]